MCRRLMSVALISALCLISTAGAQDVVWDFENGNAHGFTLWSVKPATAAPNDPNTAGDEALTGVGGDNGLPAAGLAWTIGLPTQFDGLKPAVAAKARVDLNGLLNYSLGTVRMPVDAGSLNTYNLNQHGDGVHTKDNDQIATSPTVLLYEGAALTVRSMGGGGAHPPVLDPNAALGYTDGSNGIAVRSATDGSVLATMHTNNKGTLKETALDLSAFAGQKVYFEVVDAFDGGWGWLAIDEMRITNAVVLRVVWDFENGNDHGFTLWSVKPATAAPNDPNTAGDEALTGVGGPNGLPAAGLAWTIGLPTQFDGLKPAIAAKARVDPNGLLNYSLGTLRMARDAGTLNTYNLNMHGDGIHTKSNDQIATSPLVLLYEGAVLTVRSMGGGGAHPPELDPNAALGYTDGSNGIAVRSAVDGALLATMHTNNKGTMRETTLDLSAFAGQKVYFEVVDAFDGGWGWLAIDEMRITNARSLRAAAMIVNDTGLTLGFDQAQKDRLEMLGYDVTLATGNDVKSDVFTPAEAEMFDVLVVSESIGSGDVNKLIGVHVPVMHQESFGWSRHFFTLGLNRVWKSDPNGMVDIVNDTHPIIVDAGLNAGHVQFFTNPGASWTTDMVASLVPGAVNLVQLTSEGVDYTLIFAIEAGTELADASLAVNRIVGFSLPGNNGYPASDMTAEAWALFGSAINWLDPD